MHRETGANITPNLVYRTAIVGAITFAVMWLTYRFVGAPNGSAEDAVYPVWPASGVNMGLLFLLGLPCWPGIAIGSFLANLIQFHDNEQMWRIALLAPVGDTLEAFLGVWLVRHAVGTRRVFATLTGATRFILLAAIVATALGALVGVALLQIDRQSHAPLLFSHAVEWFVSTSLAVLVIVPVMLLIRQRRREEWSRRHLVQAIVIACLLGLLQGWLFFRGHTGGEGVINRWFPPEPMVFLSLPLVFWAGSRFTNLGSAAAVLFTASTAIVGTRLGFGPFIEYPPEQALTILQGYLAVIAIVGIIVGAVAAERAEARAALQNRADFDRLLFDELNHRVRNTLASLLSILDMGKGGAASVDEYAALVAGRIHAMARVHDLLTDRRWKAVSLRDVITETLTGVPHSRLEIAGDTVMLAPPQATAMGMILYELLANAQKHGALREQSGRVRVAWDTSVDARGFRTLQLEWSEHGSSPLENGWKAGDGLRLIDGLARSDLRGHADLNITPNGAYHKFEVLLEPVLTSADLPSATR